MASTCQDLCPALHSLRPELKSHWKLKEIGKADPKRDPTTYSRIGAAKTTRRVSLSLSLTTKMKRPRCTAVNLSLVASLLLVAIKDILVASKIVPSGVVAALCY